MITLRDLGVSNFRKLKSGLRLVSDHPLRNVLPSQMALIPLLHGLPVAVHDAILVQLLLRRLLVEHLSSSLSFLLNIRVDVHKLQCLFLVLPNEAIVTIRRWVLIHDHFTIAFA